MLPDDGGEFPPVTRRVQTEMRTNCQDFHKLLWGSGMNTHHPAWAAEDERDFIRGSAHAHAGLPSGAPAA
jgi:hypothetical protein